MAMIGELPRFYGGDNWEIYMERLEQFFEINDVPGEKKKALLITSISEDIYKTLRDVCHPELPKHKTYYELCELLNKQFIVKTSVFRERHAFYNVRQFQNESISNWFARIKKLSVDCKFGDKFEKILLDRFISGLRPSPILDRLCEEESTLTLEKAVDIAINKESSAKGASDDLDRDDHDGGGGDVKNNNNRWNNNRRGNNRWRGGGRGGGGGGVGNRKANKYADPDE